MSIALMTAVWALELPSTDKLVLLALADRADDDGHCWPGIASLTKKCSLSERALQTALGRLVAAGYVSRQLNTGKNRTNTYMLHPAANAPRSKCTPQQTTLDPAANAPNTSRTTIKNNKATPYRSNASDAFDAFWRAYPRRTAKLAAQKAFASAIKRGADPNAMTAAAKSFADNPCRDPQFTPHPATWLNQGRYDDQMEDQHNARRNGPMGRNAGDGGNISPVHTAINRFMARAIAGDAAHAAEQAARQSSPRDGPIRIARAVPG